MYDKMWEVQQPWNAFTGQAIVLIVWSTGVWSLQEAYQEQKGTDAE